MEETVIVSPEGDVTCPHCGSDWIVEVDHAVRWNKGTFDLDAEGRLGVVWLLGQSDFDHHHYLCANCLEEVDMPEGLDEDWAR